MDSFVFTLQKATNSWLDKFAEAAEHFKLDTKAYGFKVKIEIQESQYSSPLTRLGQLLIKLQKNCHLILSGGGVNPPFLSLMKETNLEQCSKINMGKMLYITSSSDWY